MKEHIDEMAKVLVDYTKKNHIMASHVILADYAEQLYNAGYRKQSEWISVEERLPEENGRYLVCVNVSHLAFTNLTIIAVMEYGKKHGFYLYSEDEPVTHWMPLPEPPKMKGD